MEITDFEITQNVESLVELNAALARRFTIDGAAVNSFWLTHKARFPALSILVRDDLASLWYSGDEDSPGFISWGSMSILSKEGQTVFYLRREPQTIPNQSIVPFIEASWAAEGFLRTKELPAAINWREL